MIHHVSNIDSFHHLPRAIPGFVACTKINQGNGLSLKEGQAWHEAGSASDAWGLVT